MSTPAPSVDMRPPKSIPQTSEQFPPDRGRFMRPATVRRHFFNDEVSLWWVRANVAPDKKRRLGHSTAGWWERDVEEWLQRKAG
jgi:hypothetical protein